MRFAFAASRPSNPSRTWARRMTQRSQRTPPTWIVSLCVATAPAYRQLGDLAKRRFRPELKLALRLRASAFTPRALTLARVFLTVEGRAVPLRCLAHEPLHLGRQLGRPPHRRRLVHDAHLERPVLRPRPHVPVAASAVSLGRGVPVVP